MTLTGEKGGTNTVVNNKTGRPKNERSERLKVWKEHFDKVLNKESPIRPIQPHEMETRQNDREFHIGPFRPAEVKNAIKLTKNGKATGFDNVVSELLKTDLVERTKELKKLFNKVKEEDVAPKSWNRGLIVKLPKKGALRECTNWRGITDEAANVGLRINAKKPKVMQVNARNDQRIQINGEQVDEVEEFVYLGALMDKKGGTTKDIQDRLSKARQTFHRMRRIRGTNEIGRKTTVLLFKTLI